jgi:long-chain-fatty-acid--CoA ligase ACSBG
MGYYQNPKETQNVFDEDGYLHSGDLGKTTKDNVLFITGRKKELIITAGGENIPPVLIESEIKSVMSFIANVMVVGEGRKYLTCLITLKEDPPGSGKL